MANLQKEELDILFDKLYQFISFTNKDKPTIYDEIKNLQGIDLHNRLVFEFSIRNKNNHKFVDNLIRFYEQNKEQIDLFIDTIKDINNFSYNMFLCDNKDFEKSNNIFLNLINKLENIEFLPFNFYDENSKYRHHLIPLKLFEIMNKMYEARALFAKNTREIQLDKKIDDKTIEYIGSKGFLMRLEKTDTSNFFIENHYLNDENSFFYNSTVLKYKTSEIEMNPSFMTHNISLNINLALDYESLEKLINDFSKNIKDLKKEQKNAIAKYKSDFSKKMKSIDDFFFKINKNVNYSKILYAYDMLDMYSKEKVKKRFDSLTDEEQKIISPIEYSKSEKKYKDSYLQKPIFLSYLNTILGYEKLSKHIEKEELKLRTIIEKRYYLEMI